MSERWRKDSRLSDCGLQLVGPEIDFLISTRSLAPLGVVHRVSLRPFSS